MIASLPKLRAVWWLYAGFVACLTGCVALAEPTDPVPSVLLLLLGFDLYLAALCLRIRED